MKGDGEDEGVQDQALADRLVPHELGLIMSPLASGYVAELLVFMFLIEGDDGERIIVDGSFQYDHVPKWIFGPKPRTPELEVPEALRSRGVDPLAIDTVIVTHLHHDHTGYLHLFDSASFYVQEAEMLESYFPMEYQAVGCYPDEWIDLVPRRYPADRARGSRIRMIGIKRKEVLRWPQRNTGSL